MQHCERVGSKLCKNWRTQKWQCRNFQLETYTEPQTEPNSLKWLGLFQVQTQNLAILTVGVRDRVFAGVCRSVLSLVDNSKSFLQHVPSGPLYIIRDSAMFNSLFMLPDDAVTYWVSTGRWRRNAYGDFVKLHWQGRFLWVRQSSWA